MAAPLDNAAPPSGKFRFAIESGGTFTDIYAEVPDAARPHRVLKLLSVDPKHYASAPLEGIRRILESVTGVPHPRGQPLPYDRIESIRMGTTVRDKRGLERAHGHVGSGNWTGGALYVRIGAIVCRL